MKENQFKEGDSKWSVQFEIPLVICITIQYVLMAAVMRLSKFMKNIYLLTQVTQHFYSPLIRMSGEHFNWGKMNCELRMGSSVSPDSAKWGVSNRHWGDALN